jgi:hypothetical protein
MFIFRKTFGLKEAVAAKENIERGDRRFTSAVKKILDDIADDIIGRQVRGSLHTMYTAIL